MVGLLHYKMIQIGHLILFIKRVLGWLTLEKQNHIKFFYSFLIIIWERQSKHEWGEGKKGRESQVDSTLKLSMGLDAGLDLMTLYHDLSPNKESDTKPIDPPRRPKILLLFLYNSLLFLLGSATVRPPMVLYHWANMSI